MAEIRSAQNPKIKLVKALRRRHHRDQEQLFLIEGYRELSRAQESWAQLAFLLISPELFLKDNEQTLIDGFAQKGVEIFQLPAHLFERISYRDRPDGLLGIAKIKTQSLEDLLPLQPDPFFIIAEAIEKPGNLGTILRSADGAGVDGVMVSDACTDIFNPNVVRASVGTLFTQPVVMATTQETLDFCLDNKIQLLAATPSAKVCYTDVDLSGPLAIAVGTEQVGLSEAWMSQADLQVRIPMRGVADSLNVSVATTLLLYEVVRQRAVL